MTELPVPRGAYDAYSPVVEKSATVRNRLEAGGQVQAIHRQDRQHRRHPRSGTGS
jgi:hypothetical protein